MKEVRGPDSRFSSEIFISKEKLQEEGMVQLVESRLGVYSLQPEKDERPGTSAGLLS